MTKCENCYHYEACRDFTTFNFTVEKCNTFKDKSLIVELPCRVGDVLWQLSPITRKPISFTVPDIHWIIEYAEEFGKTVFLTREEAERALEEREKNEM